jgi:hypothetical protein
MSEDTEHRLTVLETSLPAIDKRLEDGFASLGKNLGDNLSAINKTLDRLAENDRDHYKTKDRVTAVEPLVKSHEKSFGMIRKTIFGGIVSLIVGSIIGFFVK